MVYVQSSSLLSLPLPTLSTPSPTILTTSHGDYHCDDPRDGALFGRFAEQSLFTG